MRSRRPSLEFWIKAAGKVGSTLTGAAVEGGINYLTGQSPLAGALGGGIFGLTAGAKELEEKLTAARHLNATGVQLPAASFAKGISVLGPMGAYVRKGLPGIGASGAFAPSNPQ